jgi:hypothetical protein
VGSVVDKQDDADKREWAELWSGWVSLAFHSGQMMAWEGTQAKSGRCKFHLIKNMESNFFFKLNFDCKKVNNGRGSGELVW